MEKLLLNSIKNKHLIYIIQEYMREEYSFLDQLSISTGLVRHDVNVWIYYNNYCHYIYSKRDILNGPFQYYNDKNDRWSIGLKWKLFD
jgi:hypothetical protein